MAEVVLQHPQEPVARERFEKPEALPGPAEATPAPGAGLALHRLIAVLDHIHEHFGERLSVHRLAQVARISAFHFARQFRDSVGCPPHAYLTRVRMERAKALLADSDLALAEIAARVGYQTQAHFTGVFHRHVGTTPRAYRLSRRARVA